ncbi:urease accessory protein UreF [Pelagibacterium luteolum]|uniref:Urease accessory protein UreF n=1 Tax=Pelagibacterium luteolum TaxID=440168 RepID=A0A1G7SPW8_9HYPH|nr:urease accessory UreF family protein [Pelagibacterium luteolum]SDG25083.1 urease accessory protein [Pelagibacterium luteolum]
MPATRTVTPIIMADTALIRLFSWLSPAFPIGGFAYSQGLETAIADGRIRTAETLSAWIAGQLHRGPLRNDAYFLAIAARAVSSADPKALADANAYALALQISAERDKETREQARSFLDAAAAWPVETPDWLAEILGNPIALPIAFGAMAALHGLAPTAAIAGFANAAIGQQISVGVRLIPLGQTAGLHVLASLEPKIAVLAETALTANLEDISGLSYGTDIASLRHEDLSVRIFRS